LERIEPRLLMSGQPVGDFVLDYFVEDQLHDEVHTMLADAHELTGLAQARLDYGFTGSGQTVAVTGYRVVGGFDFTEEWDANPYDDGPYGSHGTHVAGIIGSDSDYSTGVAPGVDLVALRVFNDSGSGYFHWVEQALQWVHANRNAFENPITAVNLSLGAEWNADSVPSWAMLEDEFAQLEADGIFIAVAAGNSFTSYNQPGLSYPGASSHVVPVASVDDGGSMSFFSQRNYRVIAAPGRGVLSTVPDYMGNGNGLDDDFARYSGTSMASPYVAGASVLLREAYEFVGIDNVSQQTLYNLMVSTADTVYDSVTAQNYHRLNLEAALDAIMPDDDFGSTASAAHGLGTLTDTFSVGGTVERLADQDWFSFTAAGNGTAHFSVDVTHEMTADWNVDGGATGASYQDGVFSFDVVAGGTYAVGLGTGAGLGHYTIDATLEADLSYVDWGEISQQSFADNLIARDGTWFTFTAAADGILTAEALFAHAEGDVDLQLFDGSRQLLAGSYGTGDSERIDVAASAGDVFFLRAYVASTGSNDAVAFRLTNLVSQEGDTVHVLGTAGDDTCTFAAGAFHHLSINGVGYDFNSTVVASIAFDGGQGADTTVLTGSAGDDHAVLRPGSVELAGAGFQVTATNVQNVTVYGGGGSDFAEFFDSAGDDVFVATPDAAKLRGTDFQGTGFYVRAASFDRVVAYSTAGGSDVAYLYGSSGNDRFSASPDYAKMVGNGFSNWAGHFECVIARGNGGADVAYLYDSAGNDVLKATPTATKLFGPGYYIRAEQFRSVMAQATAGGVDTAYLYDSAGDDIFVATPGTAKLYGTDFYVRAVSFDRVFAYSIAGGTDVAYLHGSSGNDCLVASPYYARMHGNGFHNLAKHFEYVFAYGNGRADVAYLFDSAGNDVLKATPTTTRLFGPGFYIRATYFRTVEAYATAGGVDVAYLFDSAGDDNLVVDAGYARLSGDGFSNRARLFENTYVHCTAGGYDRAYLYDSALNDQFHASGNGARLVTDLLSAEVFDFEWVCARSWRGGSDTAAIDAVDYLLQMVGTWCE
jgi:subtilisin family serine protease